MNRKWTICLADRLKMIRKAKGISLRAHAKCLGISPATLSRIENELPCDIDTLIKLHSKTGVSFNTLLGVS